MTQQFPTVPRKTPPPWLVPASLGLIIVLLGALIVVLLTRDDDSDSSAPQTTAPQVESTVPTTLPETTTTETAPAETVVDETVPTTVPATSPPTTVPVVDVAEGQAMLVADGQTRTFSVAVTCSDFWAGVQTTSHVLVDNETGHIWVVDVFVGEEGGDRGMQAVDMDYTIAAALYGQDVPQSAAYSGNIDESQAGVARAVLHLTWGEGPVSVEMALAEPTAVDDCALGWLTRQSPFVSGTQVEWLSPDESTGQRFNVLADCGGELLLTGGALLLTTYPQDGQTMGAGLVNTHNLTGDGVWWTNINSPTADETAFDQGGGGDITAAINLYPAGDRTAAPGYLSWTERPPRSVVGASGLLDDVCTAAP